MYINVDTNVHFNCIVKILAKIISWALNISTYTYIWSMCSPTGVHCLIHSPAYFSLVYFYILPFVCWENCLQDQHGQSPLPSRVVLHKHIWGNAHRIVEPLHLHEDMFTSFSTSRHPLISSPDTPITSTNRKAVLHLDSHGCLPMYQCSKWLEY